MEKQKVFILYVLSPLSYTMEKIKLTEDGRNEYISNRIPKNRKEQRT